MTNFFFFFLVHIGGKIIEKFSENIKTVIHCVHKSILQKLLKEVDYDK